MSKKQSASRRELEVKIESIAPGGDGVAKIGDKQCFVPLSAPGDLLQIDVARENARMMHGVITQIVQPGPDRVDPPCPLFGKCGGCQWQHLRYDAQVTALESNLRRSLGLDEQVHVEASPQQLGYRRVARLHHQRGKRVAPRLGFLGFRSHDVVSFDSCPVLREDLVAAVAQLKVHLMPHLVGDAEIRLAAGNGGTVAHVESSQVLPPEFYRGAEALLEHGFVGITGKIDGIAALIAGSATATLMGADGTDLEIPASSFGQANGEINDRLAQLVADWVGQAEVSAALELFAGAGNLSVMIAPNVGRLVTGELDGEACRAAERNLRARGLERVHVQRGEAMEVYRSHQKRSELVVLDPPRTGHLELARAIAAASHRAVLYVSCNPATLSRDIDALRGGGYEVVRVAGFDMFPQTSHMEAAVWLEKRVAAK